MRDHIYSLVDLFVERFNFKAKDLGLIFRLLLDLLKRRSYCVFAFGSWEIDNVRPGDCLGNHFVPAEAKKVNET